MHNNFDSMALHAGLIKILESGVYEVKGSEVQLFSEILKWSKTELKEIILMDTEAKKAFDKAQNSSKQPIQRMEK